MNYGSVVIMNEPSGHRITKADDFIELAADLLGLNSPVPGVRTIVTFTGQNGEVSYQLERYDKERDTFTASLVEDKRVNL